MRMLIAILVAWPLCAATVSDTFNYHALAGQSFPSDARWGGTHGSSSIGTNYAYSGTNYWSYAYSAAAFGGPQFAQGLLWAGTVTNGNQPGVAVRIDSAADDLYGCTATIGSGISLVRRVAGEHTEIATASLVSVVGDVIRLTATGGTIACSVIDRATGDVRGTAAYSDGSPLAGTRVGPFTRSTSTSAAGLNDFIGGDLADMGDYLPYGTATQRYAAATGSLLCDGSPACPLPIDKAAYDAAAGQTWWLRAGTYTNLIWSAFIADGTAGAQIVYRAYPGESVIFDTVNSLNAVTVSADYVTIQDCEFTNSDTTKAIDFVDSGARPETSVEGGITNTSEYIGAKLLNNIIHDSAQAFSGDGSNIIYGNVSYNISFDGPNRSSGHHSYIRHPYNSGQIKLFAENLMMSGNQFTVHGYSEGNVDYTLRGNVSQHSGGIWWDNCTEGRDNTFLMEENFISPSATGGAGLGYRYRCLGNVVRNNVFGNATPGIHANTLTFTGNRIVAADAAMTIATPDENPALAGSTINSNTYYSAATSGTFANIDGRAQYTYAQWQALGFDADSTISASAPAGSWVYVRPNAYEAGRGHVVIYNWDEADTVNADVSTILNVGDRYAVYNAMSPKTSVLTGTYAGGNLAMPMAAVSNPDYIATDLGSAAWNTGTPGQPCGEAVAIARGWDYGTEAKSGACEVPSTDWYLNTTDGQMYWCSSGTWTPNSITAGCLIHTFTRTQTSAKNFAAFLIRRTYDARPATVVQFRGAVTDTVEAGYKKADGTYTWGDLPAHSLTCTDGLCRVSIPQAVGDAYYRINGGAAMRAAAN